MKRKHQKIYIVECGEFIKVGIAHTPSQRLRELQVGNPHRLKIAHTLTCSKPKRAEAMIHLALIEFHERGEWFKMSANQATEIAAQIIANDTGRPKREITDELSWARKSRDATKGASSVKRIYAVTAYLPDDDSPSFVRYVKGWNAVQQMQKNGDPRRDGERWRGFSARRLKGQEDEDVRKKLARGC